MKLLLDENLSPRLLRKLESAYPGSEHVQGLGLQGRDDNTGVFVPSQLHYKLGAKEGQLLK